MKVLVTCPPMLGRMEEFLPRFDRAGLSVEAPVVVQTLAEERLRDLVPRFDGWIIGDDPATRAVFAAGRAGRLRAAVKWGVGVDNVDFGAAKELGILVSNTPGAFGREVADLAMCYVTALARHVVEIDRSVRAGQWTKPAGTSLAGKAVALVGLGDIGTQLARRLLAAEMHVIGYDPAVARGQEPAGVELAEWPERLWEADFVVLACALTSENRHLLGTRALDQVKTGVRVINVARGPLIDEVALVRGLETGRVAAAALDVFEAEPLPIDSALRDFPQCIFGSHNASNTVEAVRRTSERAIDLLLDLLNRAESA